MFLIGGCCYLGGGVVLNWGEVVLNWGVFPSMTTCSLPPTAEDIAPATPPLTEPVPDVGEAQTFDAQVQPPVPPLAEEMAPAASLLTWKKAENILACGVLQRLLSAAQLQQRFGFLCGSICLCVCERVWVAACRGHVFLPWVLLSRFMHVTSSSFSFFVFLRIRRHVS